MKSKNLVSLSVAAVFTVLSITGLLIYLGQGNHTIDHTHAWFGVLFFAASIFHIVNNWSSLKGYSTDRRKGGLRKELILPALLVLLFVAGIALDWPVFKDLANAGKNAFGKPKKAKLTQVAIDSIARSLVSTGTGVPAQSIQFDTTAALTETLIMAQGTASRALPDTARLQFMHLLKLDGTTWSIAAAQTGTAQP